ncbi:MAG: hypothetical protein SFX73_01125 [Kofleriaceae bacterium]|nr:hypothetical protein [Kofleriaceae bacterium]
MLLFRSLCLGLLGACVLLLSQLQMRPASHVHVATQVSASAIVAPTSPPASSVINIATRDCGLGDNAAQVCFATDLLPLFQLAHDERVLDVVISGPRGERRVVVRMP